MFVGPGRLVQLREAAGANGGRRDENCEESREKKGGAGHAWSERAYVS